MLAIIRRFQYVQNQVHLQAEGFTFHHPYLSFGLMFVGLPMLILLAVSLLTACGTFLAAWMFGWV